MLKESNNASLGQHDFALTAPMTRPFNHLIAGSCFAEKFGRWPLPPDDPAASINDLIFDRMIEPQWSTLQRAFVDKSTAKAEAERLCSNLRVPKTLISIAMAELSSVQALYDRLQSFIGADAIAKPTHARVRTH